MNNKPQCPNCRSFKTKVKDHYYQVTTGGIIAMVGVVIILASKGDGMGFIFATPLLCWGGFKIYQGLTNEYADCHCDACNYNFQVRNS